jgi:hypothetical protein
MFVRLAFAEGAEEQGAELSVEGAGERLGGLVNVLLSAH